MTAALELVNQASEAAQAEADRRAA
jgi:hypothetical protein